MPNAAAPAHDAGQAKTPAVRVLDLTGLEAAYAGRVMAEAGAEVVRVDPVGAASLAGDPLHEYFNAGKASVTLDPARSDGAALLRALATWADIVVESQPAAWWATTGLTPEGLVRELPALVLMSVETDEPGLDARSAELLA